MVQDENQRLHNARQMNKNINMEQIKARIVS
jgi:hypothetical protein